jgi:HK97 family phage major capsid protein
MTPEDISKQIDGIENSLAKFQEKAKEDIANTGKIAAETKAAIDNLGEKQREMADKLLKIEQRGGTPETPITNASWGKQFTNSDQYKNYIAGNAQKARFEVQNNTLVGSPTVVAPDREARIYPGPFLPLTLEAFLPSIPTTSNAVEYTRENSWTNNAAETAEGLQKPESALTWTLVNMPISTVAHWIKISRQLAADAPSLAAYVNTRMIYGVNQKVEIQLAIGDGVPPRISGLLNTGNYTPHGIANAALGTVFKKLVLIRKTIADLWASGYVADAIVLNPSDWAAIEIELLTTVGNQTRVGVDAVGNPRLFGIPVIQAIGMTAGQFLVGAFAQAAEIYNRQGVMVELSESDADNFTKNLVTIRAERRLALAVEVPAAIRGGTLTPA